MSLFSYARRGTPADNARELLLDYEQLLHDGLKWRSDSLRRLADSLDAVREELELGIDDVVAELARGVLKHDPEERYELRPDDDGERG